MSDDDDNEMIDRLTREGSPGQRGAKEGRTWAVKDATLLELERLSSAEAEGKLADCSQVQTVTEVVPSLVPGLSSADLWMNAQDRADYVRAFVDAALKQFERIRRRLPSTS